MILSGKQIVLISLAMTVLISSSLDYSYGQTRQDLSCPGCIQIENPKKLEIHRFMEFPIILWAENYMYTYDHGSKITINGHSNLNHPEIPITITVTNPIGNFVTVDQIMVNPNTDFQVEFNPSGPLWKQDGTYIIKAQGGPQTTVFKTKINLISMDSASSLECNSNEITVLGDNGGQYCLPFESLFPLTGMEGFLSIESKTLTLNVRGSYAQIIDVDINRKILNAESTEGNDTPFVVMVNGEPADFEEQQSDLTNHRKLSISYPAGDVTIEITGTSVIPEFGSIAVLILVVAIIAGVVFSRKRLQISSRFQKFQ